MNTPRCGMSLVVVVLLVQLTFAADKPPAKVDDIAPPKTWVLDVEIVDKATGEGIPNLPIAVQADRRQFAFSTDARGHAMVEYPDGAKMLWLSAKPDGYLPMRAMWGGRGQSIPDSFKLEMEHGTTIGGIVKDPQGRPIKGAQVAITFRQNKDNDVVAVDLRDYSVTTDADGRWSTDKAPADLAPPGLKLTHPDFVGDEFVRVTDFPVERLRDGTAVSVMTPGVSIGGRVLDPDNKPVRDAVVALGETRFGRGAPKVKSDADGRFLLPHCRPGRMQLFVNVKGFAPLLRDVEADHDQTDVNLRLAHGQRLAVRVQDKAGKPIAGATVRAAFWRNSELLDWQATTDAEGRTTWADAPEDRVLYSIYQEGYMQKFMHELQAGGAKEQVVTLLPGLQIAGTVTDAQTGAPVKVFTALHGWTDGGNRHVFWDRNEPSAMTNDGRFNFSEGMEREGYAVRIEADGYLPSESRVFTADEGSVTLEFKLKKGRAIEGKLRDVQGRPLRDAEVLVAAAGGQIFINDGRPGPQTFAARTKSNEFGEFTLSPQIGEYSILVVHPDGFAQLKPAQLVGNDPISIPAWGRIEGDARQGDKPGAGLSIGAISMPAPGERGEIVVRQQSNATADEKGHFVIEHVPPGPAMVAILVKRSLAGGMTTVSFTRQETVDVVAGQTAKVTLGGKGRPVIAKLLPSAELNGKMNWDNVGATLSAAPNPAAVAAAAAAGQNAREQITRRRAYPVMIDANGALRIEDVLPGDYVLTVRMMRPAAQAPAGRAPRVAVPLMVARVDVTVGERKLGKEEAVDLGDIEMKAVAGREVPQR